jgi:hypothetical protein
MFCQLFFITARISVSAHGRILLRTEHDFFSLGIVGNFGREDRGSREEELVESIDFGLVVKGV